MQINSINHSTNFGAKFDPYLKRIFQSKCWLSSLIATADKDPELVAKRNVLYSDIEKIKEILPDAEIQYDRNKKNFSVNLYKGMPNVPIRCDINDKNFLTDLYSELNRVQAFDNVQKEIVDLFA